MTAGEGGRGDQETLRVAAGVMFPLRAGVCGFSRSCGGGRRWGRRPSTYLNDCWQHSRRLSSLSSLCRGHLVLSHLARPQRVTLPACSGCAHLHGDCPGLHPSQCPPGSARPLHPRPPMTAHFHFLIPTTWLTFPAVCGSTLNTVNLKMLFLEKCNNI